MFFRLFKVSGDSMVPAFREGDYVITRHRRLGAIRPGDVVTVNHPRFGRIIKRVKCINPDATYELSGDNALGSTPTDELGATRAQQILGKVIGQIKAR